MIRKNSKYLTLLGLIALSFISVDVSAQVAERDYHVVESGDTLYDLSGNYYSDVYQWPKLWGFNPHITNPHWIYPGDIIYLKEAGAPVAAGKMSSGQKSLSAMHLPVAGMVTNEVEFVGEILASPKEANMLSEHDTVWFELSDENKKSSPGEIYAIVRPDGEVESEDGRIGTKYYVVGTLKVTEQKDKYYDSAIITQGFREILRGDKLIPYERQIKVIQPIQSDKDLVAQVVEGMTVLFHYGEFHYIFVNRGAKDGIRPGNRFFVLQQKEGLEFGSNKDDMVPFSKIGQVMVLDVREDFSFAVVTDSSKEINPGDRLEMYKGY